MTASHAAKGKANARDASLSPPPLKKRKVESTTTSGWIDPILRELADGLWTLERAVSSFFTPTSMKEPERITWQIINETLLLASHQPITVDTTNGPPSKRRKIAAFDLVSMSNSDQRHQANARDASSRILRLFRHLLAMSSPKMPQTGGGGISVFPAFSSIFMRMGTSSKELQHVDLCHTCPCLLISLCCPDTP